MDAEYTVGAEAANMRSFAESSCAAASEGCAPTGRPEPDDAMLLMLPPGLPILRTPIGRIGVACHINETGSAQGLREVGHD
ncbi:hypothetical protein A4G29_00640 [Mycobacterium kansasii]|nr:hypothetical protein A4G29_00640 [Mycobacterium kansasii]